MRPWQRWGLVGLGVVLVVGGITRAIVLRKAEKAQLTQTAQSTQKGSLQLAPGDWAVAERTTLSRTVEVSGSLRAVNSVVIKSRVSGELR
jgi:multidrug efflux pump subunit AcrA (membrane-fusion protein)